MQVIHPDPPMREEIARGFYPAFENRWRRAEVVGRWVMVAFVGANVLGAFGQGLFSEREAANADTSIRLLYEPVVRFGAPTKVQFDTRVPPGGDKVAVTMAKGLADHFGLESIIPRPSVWEAGADSIRMEFPVVKGQERVTILFAGSPGFRGGVDLWARLDAGETLSWSQYSVP